MIFGEQELNEQGEVGINSNKASDIELAFESVDQFLVEASLTTFLAS